MTALWGHIAVKSGGTGNRGHQQIQGTVSIQIGARQTAGNRRRLTKGLVGFRDIADLSLQALTTWQLFLSAACFVGCEPSLFAVGHGWHHALTQAAFC